MAQRHYCLKPGCGEEIKDTDCDTLPCGHKFHSSCVCGWKRARNECPECREEVDSGTKRLTQNETAKWYWLVKRELRQLTFVYEQQKHNTAALKQQIAGQARDIREMEASFRKEADQIMTKHTDELKIAEEKYVETERKHLDRIRQLEVQVRDLKKDVITKGTKVETLERGIRTSQIKCRRDYDRRLYLEGRVAEMERTVPASQLALVDLRRQIRDEDK